MLIPIASLMLQAAPVAPSIEVGRFDPNEFQELRLRERRMPWSSMLTYVERILRERRCAFAGQVPTRYDIRVPYVVRIEPDGSLSRVVVADVGCAPLETYVGTMVRELARAGDLRQPPRSRAAWYSNEARFTVE